MAGFPNKVFPATPAIKACIMSLTLTPRAADRVKQYLSQPAGGIGLSVAVKKSGCSGWSYVLDIAKEAKDGELVFISEGIQIRVPEDSLAQLAGTEIDFVSEGLNQQFLFRNPRVTAECGCGESFTTAEDKA
jgi:iron-sulfur cluster assembly protein